jgi:hypothetical protein
MATINLGNIKFNWQGAYNGATAYVVDDVVSYNGSSYICKLASTGNLPTNATYWDQMSSAGTNGTNGTDLTTTLTTQGDLVYRDGSGLQRLGAGTAGQVLQTGGAGANPSWTDSTGGIVSSGGFSAGQNVFTYSFSNQTDTSSNSFIDITGSEFNLGGGALTENKTCIFQYSVMRYEVDWNHSTIAFQYSTDDGSTWNYFESSENVHDEEMESASPSELATRSSAFLLHNFTSGQTPRFRMKGSKYGSSNNLKINYDAGNDGTVSSHYVVWFI